MERGRAFFERNRRLVLAFAITVVVAVVGIIIFAITHSVDMYVSVAPYDAEVKVGFRKYTSGHHKVFVGRKKVTISGENIDTDTFYMSAGVGSVISIEKILPEKDGSYAYIKQSRNDYMIAKHQISQTQNEALTKYVNDYEKALGLKYVLPLGNSYYNSYQRTIESQLVDGTNDERCEAAFCILIKGGNAEPAKARARETLKSYGFNLDDYVVIVEGADEN